MTGTQDYVESQQKKPVDKQQPNTASPVSNNSLSPPSTKSSFDSTQSDSSINDSQDYKPVKAHWFYCDASRKKSRSSTQDIMPTWQPFSISDSDKIEARWTQLQDSKSKQQQQHQHQHTSSSDKKDKKIKDGKKSKKDAKLNIVPTDQGLYDVNLSSMKRTPVYWRDELFKVRRCTWFYKRDGHSKFEPYDEITAEKLENYYKSCSLTCNWNKRFHLRNNELLVISGPNLFTHYDECPKEEWLSIAENPYSSRQVNRGVDGIFNLEQGEQTFDGQKEEDVVDHLVFFVHGIGGICDIRFRSLVEVIADFRRMANNMLAETCKNNSSISPINRLKRNISSRTSLTSSCEQAVAKDSENQQKSTPINSPSFQQEKPRRVEFLPISWHSQARKETGINDQLKVVTESNVSMIRNWVINKLIIDALSFSFGPLYSQTIIDIVGNEINRLYTIFLERHPSFKGSVSLAGHSLGSVILFDMLANQKTCRPQPEYTQCNHLSTANYEKQYEDLDELFKDLDIVEYVDEFKRQKVDLDSLIELTDLNLKEMRVPLGARRKLCNYINFMRVSYVPRRPLRCDNKKREHQTSNDTTKGAASSVMSNNIGIESKSKTGHWCIDFPQLMFEPRCFFVFGSPVTMFLIARGITELSADYKLPTCDRMFNIYHPYDPFGYRLEPFIDERFKSVEPMLVPHHKGGKRIHVQLREGIARVGSDLKQSIMGSLRSTWSSFTRFTSSSATSQTSSHDDDQSMSRKSSPSRPCRATLKLRSTSIDVTASTSSTSGVARIVADKGSDIDADLRKKFARSQSDANFKRLAEGSLLPTKKQGNCSDITRKKSDASSSSNTQNDQDHEQDDGNNAAEDDAAEEDYEILEELSDLSKASIGKLNGGRRIDYKLQEKPYEYMLNNYMVVHTSHAGYWGNEDSAMMILNEIYRPDNIQLFEYFD